MSSPYLQLRVVEITPETPDAITIHFERSDKKSIAYKPGQFLTLILTINGQEVRRSYSLSSTPHEAPRLSVTVKRVARGLVSGYLLDNLKIGDEIKALEPLGSFCHTCSPDLKRNIILFGAGSGITPLMAILKSVLQEEPDSSVTLLYGNRDEESIIFKDQLEKLNVTNGSRLHVEYVFSQSKNAPKAKGGGFLGKLFGSKPKQEKQPQQNNVHYGRMNQSMILKIVQNLSIPDPKKALCYVCGPQGMMEEVFRALQVLHVPQEQIYKESFVSIIPAGQQQEHGKVSAATADTIQTQTITIIYEGSEYRLEVPPNKTILEAGLHKGIDLPYSCQAGLCTACRGKCLSGKVHLDESDGLSIAELDEGYVLNCVGHPLTDDVIIEIG